MRYASFKTRRISIGVNALLVTVLLICGAGMQTAMAANGNMDVKKARVIEHWTQARMQSAIPRDLVIDPKGQGYLRKPDGSLEPYGRQVADTVGQGITPNAKPSGGSRGGDTTPPAISNMDPAEGAEIGQSYTFSATVTDASGVKSVSFVIQHPDGNTQSFNANSSSNDSWSVSLQGFSDGNWAWWVIAKDSAKRGGNSATSPTVHFTVNTGGSSGGSSSGGSSSSSDTVTNAAWSNGGAIQTAAGRLYFEMPGNSKWKGPWTGYVCSGTVVTDDTTGRSIIMTAAHCVYDDANKAFARNVLFIPDQADTSGSGTDLNCNNDPLGCWVPSFGVVDENWTTAVFPDNIAWDYAYYAVTDSGAHAGSAAGSDSLDAAAGSLPVSFLNPNVDDGVAGATSIDFTYALGYSYNDDPNFMYCAEDMTTEGAVNWWLSSCGLSGGSSGGPWIQPMDTSSGSGPLISVNSWGYTSSPGMAGPKLAGTSAECVFNTAKGTNFLSIPTGDGYEGVAQSCP
jgi:hypothetical protein